MSQPAWGAGPTTAPALNNGPILVLPFTALNKSEYQPWLGRAVQQSLLADLTTAAPTRMASADDEARDAATALAAGRKAHAAYVVYGSFATAGQDLRVTGQVLDVATGHPMAGIKATGPVGNVFQLEDQLAVQVRQRLALAPEPGYQPQPATTPDEAADQLAPPEYGQPNAGPQVYYPQEYGPAYPDYGYPDLGYGAYPGYYGYGYGYPWYGGVVINEGFGRRHFHDRDGDDRLGGHRNFANDPARNYYYGRNVVNGQVLGDRFGSARGSSARTSPRVYGGGRAGASGGAHFGGGMRSFGGGGGGAAGGGRR